MINYTESIQNIRINCTSSRYLNEIKYNNMLNNQSKDYLYSKIIKKVDENEVENVKQSETKNMFTNIDKYVYQKYWHKLKPFHQKVKIAEYVSTLNYPVDKKDILLNSLYTEIDSKNLTKKKMVDYDPIECIIKSISGLVLDTSTNMYVYN
jgi:hypothetical protein